MKVTKDMIKNQDVFTGKSLIVFDIAVVGHGPNYADEYEVKLSAKVDGVVVSDTVKGPAAKEVQKRRLSVPTGGSTDVTDITVEIKGKDVEYWAGNYGTIFKDMQLYLDSPDYVLLDDTSDWHISDSSAITRDDADGLGKEIQFSYYWDDVYASAVQKEMASNMPELSAEDTEAWLNFDVNVKGGWPTYEDQYKIKIQGLMADNTEAWSFSKSGTASATTQVVHQSFDFSDPEYHKAEKITVTLSGKDVEYWAGNYGPTFQGMNLYFTFGASQTAATTLAAKSAASDSSNLGSGYMAGIGAAVIGLGAFALYKRKSTQQVKNGAFEFDLP